MAQIGEIIIHEGFRIAVLHDGGKYIAWIEGAKHQVLESGYSFGEKISTRYYDDPDHALAAAIKAIDTGEVKVHG
jgi:hypothetical protein